jgi:hypothetical protein
LAAYQVVEHDGDAYRRETWVVAPRAEIAPGSDVKFDGVVGVGWQESDTEYSACAWAEGIVAFDWGSYWAADPDFGKPF